MTSSRPLLLLIPVVVCLSTLLQSQQPPPDPRPQATFKTGIDVVQLDVSVFDKDRRPIRGLTMEDFTVLENGKPQPIVATVPVDVADAVTPSAPWVRDAPMDVVTNSREPRRLITIVLDDGGLGAELGEPKSLRNIAHRIVDGMGPDDLASVVYTYLGRPQNWTADRSRLRAAIESFVPQNFTPPMRTGRGVAPAGASPRSASDAFNRGTTGPIACQLARGGCLVDTLLNVGTVLQEAPPGRKIVMLISSNGGLDVLSNPDQITYATDAFRALQRANAAVYAFDPRGLTTASTGVELDDLRSIAGATGGRVFANTNAPEARVPDVFRENGSYYLIGFRRADPARDGRFRRVQVRVNRPDAEVRTRAGYYAPRADGKSPSGGATLTTGIDAALTGIVPSGEVPIAFSVAAFAVPGKREAVLAVVAGLEQRRASDGGTQRLNLVATLFDVTQGKSHGTHRQTVEITPQSGQIAFDVYSRLRDVKPGRYEVRFAAERDGRAGSVFTSIDVPEFSKQDLALSGVLVERTPSGRIANPGELATVTTVKPTATRTFTRDQSVRAFLRVYQKTQNPVRVSAKIVNDRNQSTYERIDDLAGDAFRGGSADYQVGVPLAEMVPGQYLLTIEAVAGDKRLTRDVRFSVQ